VDDPTVFLVEPTEADDSISNRYVNPLDLFNYLSPSAWLNEAINSLTGVDVYGWFTDWVGGDWAAVSRFGDAMSHVADCLQQLGINIQQGALDLDQRWHGNAADGAYLYFSKLAAATSGQQMALRACADSYQKAARGAWQLANQLGNILQALADKAIIAGIAAAAGTVTAETGVGAVAGYGIAGLMAVQMLELVNRASTIINTAGTVILGFFGAALDLAHQGGDLSAVPLPSVAYTSPGA
jgi:hypothetical protein